MKKMKPEKENKILVRGGGGEVKGEILKEG